MSINEFKYVNTVNLPSPIPDKIYEYFYYFPKPLEELFNKDIITTFYSTKYLFKKLEDFYNMMKKLIQLNKEKLNINISKNNYRFDKSNFIFFELLTSNYNEDFNNLFNLSMQSVSSVITSSINKDDKDFISKFEKIDGVFNLLSSNINPFFLNLFDENYNKKYRDFFMNLFKEYNEIRKTLLDVSGLKRNAGILSLESFIEYDIKHEKSNNILNENINNENNSLNIVLFKSNNKIYEGINKKKISSTTQKISTKPKIDSTNYSLFYKKNLSNVVQEYSTKIHKIFKELHEKITDFVLYNGKRSLYEILLISIDIDYISLKFFYSFIESSKFKIITDTSIKINSYIYDNIGLYKQNLPSFLSWKQEYVNSNGLEEKKNSSKNIDEEGLIFQKILEKFFTNWTTKTNNIKKSYNYISNKKQKINDLNKGFRLVTNVLKK